MVSAPPADHRERVQAVAKQFLLQTIMPSMMRDNINVTLNGLALGLACVYVTAGARRDRRQAWAFFTKALEASCAALVDQLRMPPRHRYVGNVFRVGDDRPWFSWWIGAAYDTAARLPKCVAPGNAVDGGVKTGGKSLQERFPLAGMTPGSYSRRREEARLEALLARLNWRAAPTHPELSSAKSNSGFDAVF